MLPWNVHPRVEHVAVGVGYFNDGMLVGVKGHFCERISRHGVKRGAGKGIWAFLDGNVHGCSVGAGHGQGRTAPINVDVRDGGVVFPGQGVLVFVFPEPLLAGDFHVVGIIFAGNDPDGCVGGESEDDEPRHNHGGQDVEEHLEFGVVPIRE